MRFVEIILSHGPVIFIEIRKGMAATSKVLMVSASEAALPDGCVSELDEIVLGECFAAFWGALPAKPPSWILPMQRSS